MRLFLKYFFQGLLYVAPIGITLYMVVALIAWIDSLLLINIPGLGFLIIVTFITMLGYFGSHFLAQPVIDGLESVVKKIPLLGLVYTSIKDLTSAFVGKKKKFNQPVLVNLAKDSTIQRLGFVTQPDLSRLGLMDKVAVYFPHSYNISGNLFIVPREQVTPVKANGADLMKFIVSGGVADF
ncbi:MAG TPA: DUF502 domain-containing protein [Cytophagales bacterium]|nr:DUF502 domain-containing protein [Cytophagales bacterium]